MLLTIIRKLTKYKKHEILNLSFYKENTKYRIFDKKKITQCLINLVIIQSSVFYRSIMEIERN